MAITAAQVKELREMTGAGMMDCKKALTATDGDMDKAVEFLREKGLATAQKKALPEAHGSQRRWCCTQWWGSPRHWGSQPLPAAS